MATSSPFTAWPAALLHFQEAWTDAWQPKLLPYASSGSLALALQLLLMVIALTWLASVVTRNYSFTDRLWSIMPGVFAWHFAYHAYVQDDGVWDLRMVLMAALSTLWGCRLTFNFWRKGGYKLSEEDYRWAVVQQYMHWTLFEVLNLVFIAGYQHVLLLLLAIPSYAVYFHRHEALNALDGVATVLFLLLLLLETVADQQQWNFYEEKYARIALKKPLTGDYKAGFNRSGLFRFSRHSNFFGEMSLWWAFYLFSIAVSESVMNPSVLGTVLLTLLFMGSAPFTEYITASKYPLYKQYQRRVSMLVPWFPSAEQASDAHQE
jgi:steroid 5-alpha reductase family enzyme